MQIRARDLVGDYESYWILGENFRAKACGVVYWDEWIHIVFALDPQIYDTYMTVVVYPDDLMNVEQA